MLYDGGLLPGEASFSNTAADSAAAATNKFINPFDNVHPPDLTATEKPADDGQSFMSKFADAPASSDAKYQDTTFDWNKTKADRFVNSADYKTTGFDAKIDNETKYGNQQSWGDAMSNAFAGGAKLAGQSFMQGWAGWGNMADAMFNWDSNKSFTERLMGTPEELEAQNQKQEEVMNKYAIFSTPENSDSVFNKRFLGNMLQQGGFVVGALAQTAAEGFLTGGIAAGLEGADLGLAMTKMAGKAVTASEAMADAVNVGANVYKDSSIVEGLVNSAKKLIPLSETFKNVTEAGKQGAGALQMASIGIGGVKRGLSEANMAFTQGRMLAAGTYGDMYGKLRQAYIDKNGQEPIGDDLNKIVTSAQGAATGDFYVNSGIQLVTNRIQFGNLFDKFGYERKAAQDAIEAANKNLMSVTAKPLEKVAPDLLEDQKLTQVYEKGKLGAFGAYKDIAADFGGKTAAWEITKDVVTKGMMKWETTGGLHMLLQDTTNKALQSYYTDLYNYNPADKNAKAPDMLDSIKTAAGNQWSNQGFQSFMLGAGTSMLLSPLTGSMKHLIEGVQGRIAGGGTDPSTGQKVSYSDSKKAIDAVRTENIATLNEFYKNPTHVLREEVSSFNVQSGAANKMSDAASGQDHYTYNNAKDSGFAKVVAAAKSTNMFDALMDTVTNYSDVFKDPKDFKEGFGFDPAEHGIKDTAQYFKTIAEKVKEHGKLYDKLMDQYGDLVRPDLYKAGSKGHEDALYAQSALHDSIEMLATNRFKGERAVVRMQQIYTELGKNPTIGQSAAHTVQMMGSEIATNKEISTLAEEVKSLSLNPKMDKQGKADLQAKKKQLDALTKWQDGYKTLMADPLNHRRNNTAASKAYADYLAAVQEGNNKSTKMMVDDVKGAYNTLMEHIQLNADNGEYVDAFNTLADPANFKAMNGKIIEAKQAVVESMKQDALKKMVGDFQEQSAANDAEHHVSPPEQLTVNKKNEILDDAYADYKEEALAQSGKSKSKEDWLNSSDGKTIKDQFGIKDNEVNKTGAKPIPEPVIQETVLTKEEQEAKEAAAPANGKVENPEKVEKTVDEQDQKKVNDLINEAAPKTQLSLGRKILSFFSFASKSELTEDKVNPVTKVPYKESIGTNPEYEQLLGTTAIAPGTNLILRAVRNMPEHNQDIDNQDKKVKDSDFFDAEGKVKDGMQGHFPIGIYATVNGKEKLLGYVHTTTWVAKTNPDGSPVNIAENDTLLKGNHQKNIDLSIKYRDEFYKNHNNNANFEETYEVSAKRDGTLRLQKKVTQGSKVIKQKVKDIFEPGIHIGIVQNSVIEGIPRNILTADNTISNDDFRKDKSKEGWTVVLIPTPTGKFLVSYLNVPKVEPEHSNLIIKAWKAFHNVIDGTSDEKSADFKLVNGIVKTYVKEGLVEGEKPTFTYLQRYIDDHITHTSSTPYQSDESGQKSAFNIGSKGELYAWAHMPITDGTVRSKANDQINAGNVNALTPEKEAKLQEILSKLYYTVKLNNTNTKSEGLESKKVNQFLSIDEKGNVNYSKPMTYKEYVSGILESNVAPGVPVDKNNPDGQRNYFANPVIEFKKSEILPQVPDLGNNKTVTTKDAEKPTTPTPIPEKVQGTVIPNNTAVTADAGPGKTGDAVENKVADLSSSFAASAKGAKEEDLNEAGKLTMSRDEKRAALKNKNWGSLPNVSGIDDQLPKTEILKSIATKVDELIVKDPNLTKTCN